MPATATTAAPSSAHDPPKARGTSTGESASSSSDTAAASPVDTVQAARRAGADPTPAAVRLLTSRFVSCSTAMNTPGPTIATSR